jgi:hypothetical protein
LLHEYSFGRRFWFAGNGVCEILCQSRWFKVSADGSQRGLLMSATSKNLVHFAKNARHSRYVDGKDCANDPAPQY